MYHYFNSVLHLLLFVFFRLILDGHPLIAIHKAKYFKRQDGLALGPGAFVEGLEYATGVKAMVVGKPERVFYQEALKTMSCAPKEAVMIGDVSIVRCKKIYL